MKQTNIKHIIMLLLSVLKPLNVNLKNMHNLQKHIIIFFLFPTILFAQQSKGLDKRPKGVKPGNIYKNTHVLITNIPSYVWHRGCGPTALGMVFGYYDLHGFSDLYPDSSTIQTMSINNLIASDDHYSDYSQPLDYYPNLIQDASQTGTPHQDNSIADFMQTSKSSQGNYWGWSWSSDIGSAFEQYAFFRNPSYITETEYEYYSNNSWNEYKAEIDNNRPVIILVDTDGDNSTDHFVVGIGYDNSTEEFGCYDTWDNNIHWYSWREKGQGIDWGVFGFNKFRIEKLATSLEEGPQKKKLVKKIDLIGRETKQKNQLLFYLYDDGTIEKRKVIE